MQAEGLQKKPVCSFRIAPLALVVGLIPAAGKSSSILPCLELHAEAELLRLGRMNVEERHPSSENRLLLAVLHLNQMQSLIQKGTFLLRKKLLRHFPKKRDHLIMTINDRLSLVVPALHILKNHPEHPDHPHQMIQMTVRQEHHANILPGNTGLLQLMKQPVSAASVHKKIPILLRPFLVLQDKTGVVALRHHCVSGSKHCQFHVDSFLFIRSIVSEYSCLLCIFS